jgi:TRAP-type uncharacterized transport system fused permease subunit
MFVYTPILLNGSMVDIIVTIVGAIFGVVAWAMFLENFAFCAATTAERILAGVAALILLLPVDRMIDFFLGIQAKLFYETYVVGSVILIGVFISQYVRHTRSHSEAVVVAGE